MNSEPRPGTGGAESRGAAGRAVVHTVVAAALCRDAEVLLCHRAPDRRWYPNVWDLPGGHVDDGESPQAALVRELAEELGVDVSEADIAAEPHFQVVDPELHLSVWRIDAWRGEPVNRAFDEHDQIAWFSFTGALTLSLAHVDYPALFRVLAGSASHRSGLPSCKAPDLVVETAPRFAHARLGRGNHQVRGLG